MIFRTTIKPQSLDPKLHYGDQILFIGSCFAEEMGHKMQRIKMKALSNPIGILYNPESIQMVFQQLNEQPADTETSLIQNNGLWHSLLHHSQFSHPDKEVLKHRIDQAHAITKKALIQSKWLVLTFGTAFTYRHLERDMIVGNCHKVSDKEFLRSRLSVDNCIKSMGEIVHQAKKFNPDISVLCTVSPIRHLRDGMIENQKSKATLLLAIDSICQQFEKVHYFPSYEILLDDLRDYRFYAKDLTHPSDMAIDYIWDLFSNAILSEESVTLRTQILKIKQAQNHRPLQNNTMALDSFARQQLQKIQTLKQTVPMLNFDDEEAHFNTFLLTNSD